MQESDFQDVRAAVREFVRSRVVPIETEIDENDEVPPVIREACK